MSLVELLRIDRTIDIQAPPERVWRALTTAEEIAAWFSVAIEGEIAAGQVIWMTTTDPSHAVSRFPVRIVELTPPRRAVWTWHPGALDPAVDYTHEPQTTVTFTLDATGTGTRLSLSETGFDEITLARRARVYADNSKGWPEALDWLRTYVETHAQA